MKDKINKLKDFLVKNKKISIAVAVALVAVVVGVIVLLVSCGGDSDNGNVDEATTSNAGTNSSDKVTCTVEVKTEGGIPFEKMEVFIYEDSTLNNLVAAAKTDENGKMTFEAKGDFTKYVVELKNVQEGYKTRDYFEITGENTEIVLETEILPLEDMDNTEFELGSVIKDFTVTTPDGKTFKISELLAEKDAVVLNFFYLACEPCKSEFPYMQEAYAQYSDDIAVVALTPVDKDDAAIATFAEELGITFYMAQCDSKWEKMMSISSYPTTVVIDRYGVISLRHLGTITNAETFNGIFEYYTGDYKQILTKDVEDIISYEAEEGTKDKPVGILPDATGFEATLAAGEERYFEIPKVSNLIMEIKDDDAYVIYGENKYEAVDGVVKVIVSAPDPYTPAVFVLGNKGTQEKTFNAVFSAVQGTMVNPFTMTLGDFTVTTEAGNDQGVYYTYTATENGTLTLKCIKSTEGVNYDFTLYNLNTYVNRNLSVDGGDATVSIEVNAGDVVQFSVGTLPDENNEYPAGEFSFTATHTAGEGTTTGNTDSDVTYTVKVTDSNGKTISGVKVIIDNTEVITDASGVASTTLKAGSYGVRVTAPTGYKNPSGSLTVTKDSPSLTVKLSKASTAKKTYTVKVVDDNNKAIKGVSVVVGESFGTTDSNGSISFTLQEDNYIATISVPSGYTSASTSFNFNGGTSLTIKLKKGNSEETTTSSAISYTVNVVDYKNKGQSGIMVMFYSGSNVVAMQETNSSGAATVKLDKGNYTVQLSGLGTKGYDSTNTSLSSSKTSTTVMVADKGAKTGSIYDIDRYVANVGATYVDVEEYDGYPGLVIFEPTQTGKYKVSLLNSSAKLSYYGSNTSFISKNDIAITNNSYTLNVKQVGPTHIIGVSGADSCIIVLERIGNAEYTKAELEAMMEDTTYTASKAPTQCTIPSGSTLQYFDVSISGGTYNLACDSEGYYHLNTVDGPKVYVNIGVNAPYISMYTMLGMSGVGGTSLKGYFYEGDTLIKKEDYTECMISFVQKADPTYGVYPLTKDLEHMLKNGGEHAGWWNLAEQISNLDTSKAWMFACCIIK